MAVPASHTEARPSPSHHILPQDHYPVASQGFGTSPGQVFRLRKKVVKPCEAFSACSPACPTTSVVWAFFLFVSFIVFLIILNEVLIFLMQYLCIQTGWAPPPVCGPPTVFCAMKPHSQPFRGRDSDPTWTLTITRPWDRLWESMPRPLAFLPCLPSPAAGGSGNYQRLWEMDMAGAYSFPPAVL